MNQKRGKDCRAFAVRWMHVPYAHAIIETEMQGGLIMIFYFSGTGNSQAVAEIIAGELGDTAISIFKRDPSEFKMRRPSGSFFPVSPIGRRKRSPRSQKESIRTTHIHLP